MEQTTPIIQYQGSMEAREYEHGLRLHSRRATSLTDYLLGYALLAVLLVAGLLADGWVTGLIVVALLLYWFQAWRARATYRRQLRQQIGQWAPLTTHFQSRFDAHGFRTTSEYFDDRRSWDHLEKWREDDEVFAIGWIGPWRAAPSPPRTRTPR